MPLTVACAQLAPYKAEISKNLDRIAETILQAAGEGVDLIVFSETATSGYFLEGGVLECSFTQEQLVEELTSRLRSKLTRPIDAVVGFYENDSGELFNAAAYLSFAAESSECVGVYRKFFLPTYGVFDEERFVGRGKQLGVFDTRFGKVGVMICEDVWHSILPTLVALSGAEIFIVPSASPGRGFSGPSVGNLQRYQRLLKAISEEHGVFCINTQLCGFEGGKGFVGGSSIFSPFGEVVAESPVMDEHLLIAELNMDDLGVARSQSPLLSDLQSAWAELKAIASSID